MKSNLFAGAAPGVRLAEELVEVLARGTGGRIERIVSTGQASPPGYWYDQSDDEWVVLLSGEAELRVEGHASPLRLRPGDHVWLPAHCKHRVEWTSSESPAVWLAVFFSADERVGTKVEEQR